MAALAIGGYYLFANNNSMPTEDTNPNTSSDTMPATPAVTVHPISHATAWLEWGDVVVYTDPVGGIEAFAGVDEADVVVITDIHGDHLNSSTLLAVVRDQTALVVPQAVADLLPQALRDKATILDNGEKTTQKGISIEAMPMYNLPEDPQSRHTKGRGNGYVLEKDGTRVYVAGDTAGIPEMRALENIEIALVPMNLPYTMGVEEAASAVLDFAPRHVYPYHYRGQDGLADVNKFKQLVNAGNPEIDVQLLNWYP